MARVPKHIYEDNDIIVISKPSHLSVHSDGKSREYTLSDWLLGYDQSLRDVGEPMLIGGGKEVIKPGLVHRLDRETSGVMVIARNRSAYSKLKNQFKKRRVEKWYSAIVYGKIKHRFFEVKEPIGRSRKNFKRRTTKKAHIRGKIREAHSQFWVKEARKEATLLQVKPLTGRTHQIRVHCAAYGHPIVCDSLYASHRECFFGLKRTALHADKITFKHPTTGEKVVFEAPYPPDFKRAVESLKNTASL